MSEINETVQTAASSEPEKKRRKRRTKAEIEADKAAEALAAEEKPKRRTRKPKAEAEQTKSGEPAKKGSRRKKKTVSEENGQDVPAAKPRRTRSAKKSVSAQKEADAVYAQTAADTETSETEETAVQEKVQPAETKETSAEIPETLTEETSEIITEVTAEKTVQSSETAEKQEISAEEEVRPSETEEVPAEVPEPLPEETAEIAGEAEQSAEADESGRIETVQEEVHSAAMEDIPAEVPETLPEETAEIAVETEQTAETEEAAQFEEQETTGSEISETVTEDIAEEQENGKNSEEAEEVILPDLHQTEDSNDAQGHTRSISLSSIEAAAAAPIPELSVTYQENRYQKSSLLRKISDPLECMDAAAERTAAGVLKISWDLFLKWGMIWLPYVAFLMIHLNTSPFSYARMPFSSASWLWFRLVVAGLLGDLLGAVLIRLICRGNRKPSMKKILTVEGEGSVLCGLMFLIGGGLLLVHPVPGIAGTAAAFAAAAVLRWYTAVTSEECSVSAAFVSAVAGMLVSGALISAWIMIACPDIIEIFKIIMNL